MHQKKFTTEEIIKNAKKNDQYIFHCKLCGSVIVRDYFLQAWSHCNAQNKYEFLEGEKNYHDSLKLKTQQKMLNAKIILNKKDDSKKELSNEITPILQPKPELSPELESFELLNELEKLNQDKKSFEIYFKEAMKYDEIKFKNIEDLQLFPPLEKIIRSNPFFEGIYEYQKHAFEKIIAGKNIAITAPTGTGKTLSFILPVIQKIINEGAYGKGPYAVIVTPIKALTSDQFEQIQRLADCAKIRVGILMGGISTEDKNEIYANPPEILLTNFDSIYTHILHKTKGEPLFSNFKILVVDEIHYYSGIHGSNIHHVIASLKRANPNLQLIGASATIDNLKQFSQKLFDCSDIDVVSSNQKNGLNLFVMMAPAGISFTSLLLNFCMELKKRNKQFLIFWDSKTGIEKFAWRASRNGIKIEPHRAGLKIHERKEIESKFKSRKLDGLICTPTLELGIDIGSIEVVFSILVPWSNFKQRMGRAGRRDAPGYGVLMLGEDPVSEWFKKYPEDYKNKHVVHIDPKNKRVSKFMIPFRVLNTKKIQNNLIKKDEKIFLENKFAFKQKELFTEVNESVEGNRDEIQKHLTKYNLRGMGEDVKVYLKSLEGYKQTFDVKHTIGSETTPLAYQKFHIDAIYMHRKKFFKIISTHLLPNDEVANRYVIVESVSNPKYYTIPTVDKIPTIPNDSKSSEKIVGGIRIKLTDLDIDKTIRGYKRFNVFDDTPFKEIIDGQVVGHPWKLDTVIDSGTHPKNHVFSCDGEKFTFHTRGIVLEIPIEVKDTTLVRTNSVGDEIYALKQEISDGFHVIEHVLQHAGVTVANVSHENLDGIYDKSSVDTEFKKIYVFDDSGDGESGAVESIFNDIEEVILRAFEMLLLCKGPKNNTCDEPTGCSKCSFLMLKCSQFNENLYKPEALKILGKIVTLTFEEKLKKFKDEKWQNQNDAIAYLDKIEKQFGHLIPNVSKQINKLKNSTIFKNLDNKNNDLSQNEKIEKNETSKKQSVVGPIVENKNDWNDDFEDEYGFNSRNSGRLNSSDGIIREFCPTCGKNGIWTIPYSKICDVCGTSPPMNLGTLSCGRYFSPKQNNGYDYNNSLLSKCILENKKENPVASDLLSNFIFDFIKNHHKFFDNLDFDLIIPVPNLKSDPQNVAAVSISLKLSKLLNIPCNTNILIKTQSTVGRKDHKTATERRNMANSSYDICSDAPIQNKSILLIDDVLVGGSTTEKCADLLANNGANKILIMCLGEYSSYD